MIFGGIKLDTSTTHNDWQVYLILQHKSHNLVLEPDLSAFLKYLTVWYLLIFGSIDSEDILMMDLVSNANAIRQKTAAWWLNQPI